MGRAHSSDACLELALACLRALYCSLHSVRSHPSTIEDRPGPGLDEAFRLLPPLPPCSQIATIFPGVISTNEDCVPCASLLPIDIELPVVGIQPLYCVDCNVALPVDNGFDASFVGHRRWRP